MATSQRDLTRTILAVLCLVGLIAVSFWILRPFLPALIWATMIVVATWPLMLRVQAILWGRRWLAVTVMTMALLLVFVVPFSLAIGTIIANADEIVGWVRSLGTIQLPAPPDWLQAVPVIGRKAASAWREFAASGPEELGRRIAPYAEDVARWFLAEMGSFGVMAAQFLLTVVISAILFAGGETVVRGVRRFARRLAG
ncbi:MAG: AI-2E family transporter YdiK, partial [Nitrospiraceae bacterium]